MSIKRSTEFLTFADAARFRAMGYAVAPVHPGEKAPRGPWCVYQIPWDTTNDDAHVAVLCKLPPPRGVNGVTDHAGTWVTSLHVQASGPALDAIKAVVAARVTYPAPARIGADGTLWPFQLRGTLFPRIATGAFHSAGRASFIGANDMFIASGPDPEGKPYTWVGGDLVTVRRNQLPAMDVDTAVALIAEVDTVLDRYAYTV